MFCNSCQKLAILSTKKICIRCNGSIFNNISVICDTCSKEQSLCSICLKKINIINGQAVKPRRPGCQSCGGRR